MTEYKKMVAMGLDPKGTYQQQPKVEKVDTSGGVVPSVTVTPLRGKTEATMIDETITVDNTEFNEALRESLMDPNYEFKEAITLKDMTQVIDKALGEETKKETEELVDDKGWDNTKTQGHGNTIVGFTPEEPAEEIKEVVKEEVIKKVAPKKKTVVKKTSSKKTTKKKSTTKGKK